MSDQIKLACREMARASLDYLKSQYTTEGFPPWEGGRPNAMTTAEVACAVCELGLRWRDTLLPDAMRILVECQQSDGSWTDGNSDDPWDASSTAWAGWALMQVQDERCLRACQRAADWLAACVLPSGGIPTNARYDAANTYATSYGYRFLRAIGKTDAADSCLNFLFRAQNGDGGWGLRIGEQSEATLTEYVLHGLLDGALDRHTPSVTAGFHFLNADRGADGAWGSWLAEKKSVEGTAFGLFIFTKAGMDADAFLELSVNYLHRRFMEGSPWWIDDSIQIWVAVSTLLAVGSLLKGGESIG